MARARAFNLTAEINLRGPANIRTVVADIRRQLGTINVNINPQISTNAQRNITNLNRSLTTLNNTLNNTTTSANNAAQAINNFARSMTNAATNNLNRNLNNIATTTNNLGQTTRNAGNQIATASTRMEEFGRQSALAVRRFAAFSVVTGAIHSFTNAVTTGVKAFIDFDKEFVRLQQVTGQSSKGLKGLSDEITNLATTLGVASSDLTTVSVTLAQAGLSAKETQKALKALALSSLAPSFDDMNQTVEGSIALMRQFNISADQLESALGSVNAVAAAFAVEASDLITAIQRTGGVFAASSKGVSEGTDALNEFLAVFTSIRATTRESAETIATGLRTIFARIQRKDTIDALKAFGVTLTDIEGKFVGPYEAVKRLSEGLSKLDPRDLRFSQIVEELGGFRQIGKVIPLIQQFAVAQKALGVAQKGSTSLTSDAATAQLSLANQIAKVREEFTALIRKVGESDSFRTMVKMALDLASALIKLADAITPVLPALTAMAAFRGFRMATQFGRGFRGGLGFASGGLVPGVGNSDTVSARLTPGEYVIRKKAVETIGVDNLASLNRNGGGPIQRFARGGKGKALGARSTFRTLDDFEMSKLSTSDLIKYAKRQARDVFSRGGAGMATSSSFIEVPSSRITPELEGSLVSYMGKKGFWKENISPFGKPIKSKAKKDKKDRKSALESQIGSHADEVAARAQQWKAIRSGSPIDKYLLSTLKNPILADYQTVRGGGSLGKAFHNTRLRQAVNSALDSYDDFNYSPGAIDKLVSGMAAERFASGGKVQRFAGGKKVKKIDYGSETYQRKVSRAIEQRGGKVREFGLVGLRGGAGKGSAFNLDLLANPALGPNGEKIPTPIRIKVGTLKDKGKLGVSENIEKEILKGFGYAVSSTSKILGNELKAQTGQEAAPTLTLKKSIYNAGFQQVIGAAFEAALTRIGSPYWAKTEKSKALDFPFGLGSAGNLFGVPGNIPSDATRTVGGGGKGPASMIGQIERYLVAENQGKYGGIQQTILKKVNKEHQEFLEGIPTQKFKEYARSILTLDEIKSAKESMRGADPFARASTFKSRFGDLPDSIRKKFLNAPRHATGGSVKDTIPALLTPGEFVINKNAASALGPSRLHSLNNADKIKGYNKGGVVQRFAKGGFSSTLSTGVSSALGSKGIALVDATAKQSSASFTRLMTAVDSFGASILSAKPEVAAAQLKSFARALDKGKTETEAMNDAIKAGIAAERRHSDASDKATKRIEAEAAGATSRRKGSSVIGPMAGGETRAAGSVGRAAQLTSVQDFSGKTVQKNVLTQQGTLQTSYLEKVSKVAAVQLQNLGLTSDNTKKGLLVFRQTMKQTGNAQLAMEAATKAATAAYSDAAKRTAQQAYTSSQLAASMKKQTGGGILGMLGGIGGAVGRGAGAIGNKWSAANAKFAQSKLGKGMASAGGTAGMALTMAGGAAVEGLSSMAGGEKTSAGRGISSIGGDMLNFGVMGATFGSMFGPLGTAVGAIVGAATGVVTGLVKWRQANLDAAAAAANLANSIEQEKLSKEINFFAQRLNEAGKGLTVEQKNKALTDIQTQLVRGRTSTREATDAVMAAGAGIISHKYEGTPQGTQQYAEDFSQINAAQSANVQGFLAAKMQATGQTFEELTKSMDSKELSRYKNDIANADKDYLIENRKYSQAISKARRSGNFAAADRLDKERIQALAKLRDKIFERETQEEAAAQKARLMAEAQARAAQKLNEATTSLLKSMDAMDQSFNKASYNIDKLANKRSNILAGTTSITSTKFEDNAQILKNPLAYSKEERLSAQRSVSGMFGGAAGTVSGLANFAQETPNAALKAYNAAGAGKVTETVDQERLLKVDQLKAAENTLVKQVESMSGAFGEMKDPIVENIQKVFEKAKEAAGKGEAFDINKVIEEALGGAGEAGKRASESFVKANEKAANAINHLAEVTQAAADIMLRQKERKAEIAGMQSSSRLSQKEALGIKVGLNERINNNMVQSATMLGMEPGNVNAASIMDQRKRLETTQESNAAKQASLEQKAIAGDEAAGQELIDLQKNMANVNNELKITEQELAKLPQNLEQSIGDVMNAMKERVAYLERRKEAGVGLAEKMVTSTPKELAEMDATYKLMNNTLRGNITTINESDAAQKAYFEALRQGKGPQEAMNEAQSTFANENKKALDMFNELSQVAGVEGPELDKQRAMLIENFAKSTGQENSPIIQDVLKQLRQTPEERAANDPILKALSAQAEGLRAEQKAAEEALIKIDEQKLSELQKVATGILDEFKKVGEYIQQSIAEIVAATGGTPIPMSEKPEKPKDETAAVPKPEVAPAGAGATKPAETVGGGTSPATAAAAAAPSPVVESGGLDALMGSEEDPYGRAERERRAKLAVAAEYKPPTSAAAAQAAAVVVPAAAAGAAPAAAAGAAPAAAAAAPSPDVLARPDSATGNLIPREGQLAPAYVPYAATRQLVADQNKEEQQRRATFEATAANATPQQIIDEGRKRRQQAYNNERKRRETAFGEQRGEKGRNAEIARQERMYRAAGIQPPPQLYAATPPQNNAGANAGAAPGAPGAPGAAVPGAPGAPAAAAAPQEAPGMAAFANFGQYVDMLSKINLPSTITFNHTGTVSVEITGAAAFEGMSESIQTMIDTAITTKMRQLNLETGGELASEGPTRTTRAQS